MFGSEVEIYVPNFYKGKDGWGFIWDLLPNSGAEATKTSSSERVLTVLTLGPEVVAKGVTVKADQGVGRRTRSTSNCGLTKG